LVDFGYKGRAQGVGMRVRVPAHHGGGTPPLQCYGSPAFARPSTMR
jgi:hypothetical protein